MTTKTSKFTTIVITSLFVLLLFVAGARVINASAAQAELSDDHGSSTGTAPKLDDRQNGAVEFFGTIQAIEGSTWTISGQVITVQPGSEIKGTLAVGDLVKVHAFRAADGSLVLREIAASLGAFGTDGNTNSNGSFDDQSGNGNANINEAANGNGSDDGNTNLNSNDDNGNGSDDGNTNLNSNDDNGNGSDDGNTNLNSNDDNGNDSDDGNTNLNSNDDNGNDDQGNVNDHGNDNDDDHRGKGG